MRKLLTVLKWKVIILIQTNDTLDVLFSIAAIVVALSIWWIVAI